MGNIKYIFIVNPVAGNGKAEIIFKNILKSIIFGIFKTDKGMGEGDSEGIWDAAMGEMTRWVLHMGRWISLERTSWKGDHRFGCL